VQKIAQPINPEQNKVRNKIADFRNSGKFAEISNFRNFEPQIYDIWNLHKAKESLSEKVSHFRQTGEVLENSTKPKIDTRKEVAKIANVSDNTIARVKKIEEKAPEEVFRAKAKEKQKESGGAVPQKSAKPPIVTSAFLICGCSAIRSNR
jgi:hypothetical protein